MTTPRPALPATAVVQRTPKAGGASFQPVRRAPNPRGEMQLHLITAGYAVQEQARLMALALRTALRGQTVNLDTLASAVGIDLDALTPLEFQCFDLAATVAFRDAGWRKVEKKRGKVRA